MPSPALRITPLPQRAVGHGAVPLLSRTHTERARAGCAGVPSRVLRTRDRCAPLPSLTRAYGTYCNLQNHTDCICYIACAHYLVPLWAAPNERAYSTARSPYRLLCAILQASDIRTMHMENRTHDRCASIWHRYRRPCQYCPTGNIVAVNR